MFSDYDTFAWVYNKYWGNQFTPTALAVIEKLVLPGLRSSARILDLCCGTGQLARLLSDQGFVVTGIDGSAEMLKYARENAPGVEFVHQDARSFKLSRKQDAVVCMYDSLNHIMEPEGLAAAFRSIHMCLKPGGIFLFDMYLEHGYLTTWKGHYGIVEDDLVCIFPNRYDSETRTGAIDFTIFRLSDGAWWRTDLTLSQRSYPTPEILTSVEAAGFEVIQTHSYSKRRGLRQLTKYSNRGFFLFRRTEYDVRSITSHP